MCKQFVCAAATLMLGLAIIGCEPTKSAYSETSPYKDNMMATVASTDKVGMMEAPMDDTYTLYSGGHSMMTVKLKKGDMMGFKTMPDGKTMAVAGDQSMDVTGNKAMWLHGMPKQ